MFFLCRPEERTEDDIELVYEEIMNIKAFSHLSNTVKKELSAVIAFEYHKDKSTTCKKPFKDLKVVYLICFLF